MVYVLRKIYSTSSRRKGKAAGIIIERDLPKRVIVESKNPKEIQVAEGISTLLEAISPNTNLGDAIRLIFKKKMKKLVAYEKNNIIGLVSFSDIARCQPAIIQILKSFAAKQKTSKSTKKVLDKYIV